MARHTTCLHRVCLLRTPVHINLALHVDMRIVVGLLIPNDGPGMRCEHDLVIRTQPVAELVVLVPAAADGVQRKSILARGLAQVGRSAVRGTLAAFPVA
jgi:hypothetical protein